MRHHANDLAHRAPLHADGSADDVRRAAEEALPETVADHDLRDDGRGRTLVGEPAALDGLDAEHARQRRRRCRHRDDVHAVADRPDRLAGAGIDGHAVERPRPGAPVDERATRDASVVAPFGLVEFREFDEAIRLRKRQRFQQHGVHDRKHRCVRADPKRERQYRADRERRRPTQCPERDPQIGHHLVSLRLPSLKLTAHGRSGIRASVPTNCRQLDVGGR